MTLARKHEFRTGDRVQVQWFGGPVGATVIHLVFYNGRPHKMPLYKLALDGVEGHPGFREDEMKLA